MFKVAKYVGVGLVGWIGGIATVAHWKENGEAAETRFCSRDLFPSPHIQTEVFSQNEIREEILFKPGLPLTASVSAAGKITDLPVPAEPPPSASRTAQILRFGFPTIDNVLVKDNYIVSYDRRSRVAYWVFEHLTREQVKAHGLVDRSLCEFREDEDVNPFFRSKNSDYLGSGYDRGHLAAAGNHRVSQKHCDQTFLLSNIAPQVGVGFNRHYWNKLEKYVRHTTKSYRNVYVCTGPLFLPRKEADGHSYVHYRVLGSNNVAVPTHFFKVLVMEANNGTLEMEAYILPNKPIDERIPLENFQVSPEKVERAAGLLFFDRLSRNKLRRINGNKQAQG